VGAALMQWCGRTHVLMCALDGVDALHGSLAATALIIAWALTEVVRYPSYVLGLYSHCPSWLNWLRYTIFIPLYPLGAGAEMKLMYDARAFARKANMYSISMPNAWNFAFDYVTFLNGLLVVYPFLFYSLYSYMFTQRKKKLGPVENAKKQQ
jgi:very-long-chain (3R)-3-hydroxyacyl-CoA dehydratase